MTRIKALLIAESANPESESIPLIGWSHARALADLTDAHLVTQVRTREALERAGWRDGREFTAIDSSAVARPAFRLSELFRGGAGKNWTVFAAKGWSTHTAFTTLSYYYYEHLVWKQFGARIRAREFDVVHRIVPLSPAIPSLLAAKCHRAGVPFVWGPINGGVPWPKGFDDIRRKERELLATLRFVRKLVPGYFGTRRHAAAILVGSGATLDEMPAWCRAKCIYLPENGIEPGRFSKIIERPPPPPLRVAFVGRLVPLKGVDMLLEAVAPLVRDGNAVIDIIGDGPEMPRLRALVAQERMGAGVQLPGWVEHAHVQDRLAQSDVLGFPSIRDFGGGVVIEAMALGLVPVVLDHGGPPELLTEQTGYRIAMGTRDEIVRRLRDTLAELAADPGRLRSMARQARTRAFNLFSWPAKARQTLEVYRWVMGQRSTKPDFGMPLRDTEQASDQAG